MTAPTPPVALKACPFCGGTAATDANKGVVYAICLQCGSCGHSDAVEERAIAAWNQRTTPDAAAMREACAKVAEDYAAAINEDGVRLHQPLCIHAAEVIAAHIHALPLAPTEVPADVRRLVIAARGHCYSDATEGHDLDAALEAFAARVPWDDDDSEDAPAPTEAGIGAGEGEVAIPAGMKPWHGGDSAPKDWDGGEVRGRSCGMMGPHDIYRWTHIGNGADIIAYTPKPPAALDEQRAREVRDHAELIDNLRDLRDRNTSAGDRIRTTLTDAANALEALATSPRAAGEVSVPREVVDYLLGEGELDGHWFTGDKEPGRHRYWWRKHLRAALRSDDGEAGR